MSEKSPAKRLRDPVSRGELLRFVRRAKPMSMRAAAGAANIAPSTAHRIETGKHTASVDNFAAYCAALGVSTDDVLYTKVAEG